ncbi:hypothetical protein PEBR_24561 [Penicillium brasilianum]|uniref:MYND-type domain-containing protein n=1 Tax=Penicillium brasilianum TaxID=104259 RepID=A0A1S9RIX3_PENBI|nr:hypothetical protein PEBR_24561 [Penicillium brasilianum]
MASRIDPTVIQRSENPSSQVNPLISALFSVPRLPAPISGCGTCNKQSDSLIRCTGCKVMHYCCRGHMAAHWPAHRAECNRLDKHEFIGPIVEEYSAAFLANFNNLLGPAPFAWGPEVDLVQTEDTMSYLADLAQINTVASVKIQLDRVMGLLRMGLTEDAGMRNIPPALLLRLGCWQECYDLLKWYAAPTTDSPYLWKDEEYVVCRIKDADLFEPVGVFLYDPHSYAPGVHHTFAHHVFLALLKISLLLELQKMDSTAVVLRKRLPQELVDLVLGYVGDNPAISTDPRAMQYDARITLVNELSVQILTVYKHVDHLNVHFWGALLNPDIHLRARPSSCRPGSVEEAWVVLLRTHREWVLTPGTMDYIDGLRGREK